MDDVESIRRDIAQLQREIEEMRREIEALKRDVEGLQTSLRNKYAHHLTSTSPSRLGYSEWQMSEASVAYDERMKEERCLEKRKRMWKLWYAIDNHHAKWSNGNVTIDEKKLLKFFDIVDGETMLSSIDSKFAREINGGVTMNELKLYNLINLHYAKNADDILRDKV